MDIFTQIILWIVITAILIRIFYILEFDLLAYFLTIKRIKKFGNYRYPNIMFHGPLTSEKSRAVPFPTPHAMVSSCIYDVRKNSLKIKVNIPDSVYYSVTFFARNQDCYFTLNDVEVRQNFGQKVDIVLKNRKNTYIPKRDEIVVSAPRFSKIGLILVRIIIMNPEDKDEIKGIQKIQKMTTAELLYP